MALAQQTPDLDLKPQEARFLEAYLRHGNASRAATVRRQIVLTLAKGRGPARGRMTSILKGLGGRVSGWPSKIPPPRPGTKSRWSSG